MEPLLDGPGVLSTATAVPPYRIEHREIKEFTRRLFAGKFWDLERLLPIFDNSLIETAGVADVPRTRGAGIGPTVVVPGALNASETYRLPVVLRLLLHMPFLRNLFARSIAFGAWLVHAEAKRGGPSLCEEALPLPGRCNIRST
jgi:hypothetical protein